MDLFLRTIPNLCQRHKRRAFNGPVLVRVEVRIDFDTYQDRVSPQVLPEIKEGMEREIACVFGSVNPVVYCIL